jgi:hypothetical protein
MSSFVKDAITIGRKITNLAEQCVTLAIVPRIQAELAMLVMKPGFKLMDVPKAIVANLKKFTKFPRLAMEVNGTSRKVIGVLGSMSKRVPWLQPARYSARWPTRRGKGPLSMGSFCIWPRHTRTKAHPLSRLRSHAALV